MNTPTLGMSTRAPACSNKQRANCEPPHYSSRRTPLLTLTLTSASFMRARGTAPKLSEPTRRRCPLTQLINSDVHFRLGLLYAQGARAPEAIPEFKAVLE